MEAKPQDRDGSENSARKGIFSREGPPTYGPPRAIALPNQLQVFLTLRDEGVLPEPRPMRSEMAVFWNTNRYCEYHEDTGNTTAECWVLAKALEKIQETQNLPPTRQRLPAPPPRRASLIPTGHRVPRDGPDGPDDRNIGEILAISRGKATKGGMGFEGKRYAEDLSWTAGIK